VRASGGVRLVTGLSPEGQPSSGALLAPGGNAWSALSDQALKEHIVPADGRAVLHALSRLPISSWSLKSQSPDVRHLGPMAQDFQRAFGLGEDARYIHGGDADGVALLSIQALHGLVRDQTARLQRVEAALDALRSKNDQMKRELDELRARVNALVDGP